MPSIAVLRETDMTSSEDKDREVWRRYWTFWYEQRQQEADAAKRLAEEYGATFPSSSCPPRLPQMATVEMADAVRGILQILRGKPGATFEDVQDHCEMRGDDTTRWPSWVQDSDGYVTEQGAAMMIYDIMEQARYSALPESGRMKADPDAVFALAVNGSLPAEAADRVVREAAAAPSTPQPEAPTPRTDAALEKPTFEAYGRLADLARQLERELAEKDSRLAGIIFSGALDEVKCGDLQRWRNEFKAKLSASSASAEPVAWFRMEDGIRVYYETEAHPGMTPLYAAPLSSSTSITDPLLPGLLEAERILRMIGYDEEDFAMQRLLAHIAPRRVTADQMAAMSAVSATEAQEARMGGISGANQQNGSDR